MENNYLQLRKVSLQEQKDILIDILKTIDSFCRKNNIEYFLAYGTMLGAVRHKGFIPWDDDIDIIMNRENYELFSKGFNENRSDNYRFISIDNTPGYYLLTSKVCDMNTILIEHVKDPIKIGVYVDIFVNDNLGNTLKEALNLSRKIRNQYKLIMASTISDREGRAFYKKVILKLVRLFTSSIDRTQVLKRINTISLSFRHLQKCKYVGAISSYCYGEKEITESAWWDEGSIDVVFEGINCKIPKYYDKILRHFYGNYMELPPVEKRVSHHSFDAYWKEEADLK